MGKYTEDIKSMNNVWNIYAVNKKCLKKQTKNLSTFWVLILETIEFGVSKLLTGIYGWSCKKHMDIAQISLVV